MTSQASISWQRDAGAAPRRPIFLHSGYRSGSTWFWNRFRECADACAYCEPFNVKLAVLTPEVIAADRPDAWPSGHPAGIRPYNAEYEPLLAPGGGVRMYEQRFGIETYYKTEADLGIDGYLAMLVGHARRLGKVPVLGFCCSLGRVQWFRKFADGWNVVTWRNPRDQWLSCHRQWTEHANFSFEVHALLAAYIGRFVPPLAPFFSDLGPLPSPDEIAPAMPLFADPRGVELRFRAFLRVFTLDTLLSIANADLVVDLDQLAQSRAYRGSVTDRLRLASGLDDLSFEDCRLPRHRFDTDADYAALLRQERDFLETLATTPQARAFGKSLPFLRAKLEALLAEAS